MSMNELETPENETPTTLPSSLKQTPDTDPININISELPPAGFLTNLKKKFSIPYNPSKRELITAKPLRDQLANIPEEDHQAQQTLDWLHSLTNSKLTRRTFLTATTATAAAAVDQFFLHGLGRYYLEQLATNHEFRHKLEEAAKSGELFSEDLPRLVQEVVGSKNYAVELGEKVNLTEPWMEQALRSYEVRKILKNKQASDQLLLIADLGKVDIIQAVEKQPGSVPGAHVTDLELTAQRHPNIAILPRTQMSADIFDSTDGREYSQLQPLTWTTFQKPDGSIYEQLDKDGSRNPRGGAYVLIDDELRVIDSSDINKYQIGQTNCRAIQVCAYTVRSQQKEADLKAISEAETLSGLSPNSESYCSFVATFTTPDGQTQTRLISIYSHFDTNTGSVTGGEWPLLEQLSPANAAEICDQIMTEQGFSQYIIAIPDANEHSAILATDVISDKERKDYGISTKVGYYRDDRPFMRSLWAKPYMQPDVPLLFLAATG